MFVLLKYIADIIFNTVAVLTIQFICSILCLIVVSSSIHYCWILFMLLSLDSILFIILYVVNICNLLMIHNNKLNMTDILFMIDMIFSMSCANHYVCYQYISYYINDYTFIIYYRLYFWTLVLIKLLNIHLIFVKTYNIYDS